jgi:hypothetical protein
MGSTKTPPVAKMLLLTNTLDNAGVPVPADLACVLRLATQNYKKHVLWSSRSIHCLLSSTKSAEAFCASHDALLTNP